MIAETEKGRKYPKFIEKKTVLKKNQQRLERAAFIIKPLKLLNEVNNRFLNGGGELTEEFPIFKLAWGKYYTECDYSRSYRMTIALCPFLIKSNQVVKNINKLIENDTPRGIITPGIVILGGDEAKAVEDYLKDKEGLKNIYSLDLKKSTVLEIPNLLGKINKRNILGKTNKKTLLGEEGESFEEAIQKAYLNSALKV